MRATIPQPELAEAVRWAARQLPHKPTQPVLAGVLLEADGDTLTASGYNYETAGRASVEADITNSGSIVVPGRLLADIVTALPEGIVELDTDEHTLHVAAGRDRFQLPLLPDADYPTLPPTPTANGLVDATALADAIGDVAGAAMAPADAVGANTALGSVQITADGDQLTIIATDRYRIAIRTIEWQPESDVTGSILVPAPTLTTAAKSFATAGQVELAFAEQGRNVGLRTDRLSLVTRTTDTAFPDACALLPAEDTATGSIQIDTDILTKALARAAVVTDKGKALRFTIRDGRIDISARGDGPSSRISVDADIDGLDDEYAIAFNPAYMATVLAPIDGQARIWIYTPSRPVLIRPADKDADYTAVLMPVLLKFT